jgi:hypothetical protein
MCSALHCGVGPLAMMVFVDRVLIKLPCFEARQSGRLSRSPSDRIIITRVAVSYPNLFMRSVAQAASSGVAVGR